jgi:hypothetical protein
MFQNQKKSKGCRRCKMLDKDDRGGWLRRGRPLMTSATEERQNRESVEWEMKIQISAERFPEE